MNKNIAMLILSVVLLAMILIVLNQWAFGPSSVPQNSADFSDILKKSSTVKVPLDAPGVRIPVGTPGAQEMNAGNVGNAGMPVTGNASSPQAMHEGYSNSAAPAAMEQAKSSVPVQHMTAEKNVATPAPASKVAPSVTPPAAMPAVKAPPVPTAAVVRPASVQSPPATTTVAPAAKPAIPAAAAPSDAGNGKSGGANTFEAMTFGPTGSAGLLEIKATGKFGYKIFALKQPQRVVVDLTGDFSKLITPSVKPNSLVTGVRVGKRDGGVRIVMDIAGTATRSWNAEQPAGNRLRVTLK